MRRERDDTDENREQESEKTMCTFESEHRVLVCDIAIHQVREATSRAFGDTVQFTPAPGQGTRVEVPPAIDAEAFQEVARAAIAAAQQKNAPQNQ
jgi:hypothetical protein